MPNPPTFIRDKAGNRWHIVYQEAALCNAELSDIAWHLPGGPVANVTLCLSCWEKMAVRFDEMYRALEMYRSGD